MRFLGVLGFGLEDVGRGRQGLGPEITGDQFAQFRHRFLRQVGGVGTHVGNQADRTFRAQGHAFVQFLRHAHGTAGGETQLARRFLLQGGGDEGRRWAALALLALHIADDQFATGRSQQARTRGFGIGLVGQVELLELLPGQGQQAGVEGLDRMGELGLDGPVFTRHEGFDFFFALDDHAQGRRLHPTCRKPTLDLAPEHRRQVEADQVIQSPAGLLGIDQVG